MALNIRDVNIIVTTDMHSWFAGHEHEDHSPRLDADLGDFVSFVELSKEAARKLGKDVFVFDNGDVVDGSGLSNISPIDGEFVFELMKLVPYDALNVGNHELYNNPTVDYMMFSGYIDFWNGSLLSSNTYFHREGDKRSKFGSKFTIVQGQNSGIRLLVFGFLFNMVNHCSHVNVTTVESEIKSNWFKNAIENEIYDAIVLLAHMDYRDMLIVDILNEIRSMKPSVPVQVLAGHSHLRGWMRLDDFSSSFEAGHYLDTFGAISFDLPSKNSTILFDYDFTDANVHAVSDYLSVEPSDLKTRDGSYISKETSQIRSELGLLTVVGCSNITYSYSADLSASNSLWRLYIQDIVPRFLFSPPLAQDQILVQSSGSFRYDIFAGEVLVDDIWTVAPFSDLLYKSTLLSGAIIRETIKHLNDPWSVVLDPLLPNHAQAHMLRSPFLESLPAYISSSEPIDSQSYQLLVAHYDVFEIQKLIRKNGHDVTFSVIPGTNNTALFFDWAKQTKFQCVRK